MAAAVGGDRAVSAGCNDGRGTTSDSDVQSSILRLDTDVLLLIGSYCGRSAPILAQTCRSMRHVWRLVKQHAALLAQVLLDDDPQHHNGQAGCRPAPPPHSKARESWLQESCAAPCRRLRSLGDCMRRHGLPSVPRLEIRPRTSASTPPGPSQAAATAPGHGSSGSTDSSGSSSSSESEADGSNQCSGVCHAGGNGTGNAAAERMRRNKRRPRRSERTAAGSGCGGSSCRSPLERLLARRQLWRVVADADATRALLGAGADPRAHDSEALCYAAFCGHAASVALLLAAGAQVHVLDEAPLRDAAVRGHAAVAELLLAAGADVHVGNDVLLRDACKRGDAAVVRVLLAAGADVHVQDGNPLRNAALNGHERVVRQLLAAGADVHVCEDAPVILAAGRARVACVELLLAAGANVHAEGLLDAAARSGSARMMATLLDHGARARAGQALLLAAGKGHLGCVELLLQRAAPSVEAREEALGAAAAGGHLEVVQALAAAGGGDGGDGGGSSGSADGGDGAVGAAAGGGQGKGAAREGAGLVGVVQRMPARAAVDGKGHAHSCMVQFLLHALHRAV